MDFFCDPLLPGPEDYALDCGRRLNGPKKPNPENQKDYNDYCVLYRVYVHHRFPFFRKPNWIPHAASGRVEGWEQNLQQVLESVGFDTTDSKYTDMLARRTVVQQEYRALFSDLVEAIENLSNCNYVHSFGGRARLVALYDYQSHGGMDVVHDITDDRRWMFPTPGNGPSSVMQAQVTTRYFDQLSSENYVPERGIITGPDPHSRVWLSEKEPRPMMSHELCLSISKHPNTAAWYSSLLWAAVRGQ